MAISSAFPLMPWRDIQFDAYVSSANSKVKKVQPIDNTMDTVTHDATRSTYTHYQPPKNPELEKTAFENKLGKKLDEILNVHEDEMQTPASEYQVEIPSTSFGFNESTKDFFIRVQRGDILSQYPTDDMMRLKAYHKNLLDKLV